MRADRGKTGSGTDGGGAGERGLGCSAEGLGRPTGCFVEGCGGVKGPIGIAEELAGEEDEVGFAGGDDGVGLGGIGDHADGGGGDVGIAADASGEGDLIAGADGDLYIGNKAAGRDVDEVDAAFAEEVGEPDGLVDVPAAILRPIGGGDADEDGQVGGPLGTDGFDDFKNQAGAIGKASAVVVRAPVGERGKELVEKIAM